MQASVLSHKYLLTCAKGLRGKVEERGGVDAVVSSTTNDKEIVRNPFAPFGLGRDGPDLCVVPPRRYYGIDSSSRLDLRAVALPTSVKEFMTQDTSPHFSQIGYCGGRSCRPACVPLPRPSRRTVEYDCEGLSRAALSGRHLHRLATQPYEKCRLVL